MAEKKEIEVLSPDEISKVSGGDMYMEWNNGFMEVWYLCPRCFEDKVLVTKFVSGGNYQKSTVCGTFVCSNCGFTKDYELGVGGNFVFLQYRETGTWTGL